VDADKLRFPHYPWVIDHDAEEYAAKHFLQVVADIRNGAAGEYKYPPNVLQNAWLDIDTGEVTERQGDKYH